MATVRTALVLALVSTAAAAQLPTDLVQQDGRWFRAVQGQLFTLEDVISVVLAPGVVPAEVLGPGEEHLRTSPLGVLDLRVADPVQAVSRLLATDLVLRAEVNALGAYVGVPNDPQFNNLWHLHNTGQTGGTSDADVDAVEAWDITGGDPSIVVAVIDSGTEITHVDLAANVWVNPDEVAGNALDDDLNGFIDDVNGWDFEANNNNPNGSFFHGTSVAGVVAAVGNNGIGIAGLAGGGSAGGGCRVLPVNCGSFAPITSVLDDAVLYAANEGVRVITLSLTVPDTLAVTDALAFAHDVRGVFIDCASGNNGFSVTYPATLPTVVAVASTNDDDVKSSFSNPGADVEVSAPGENVQMLSTGNSYAPNSGTSFAAPHVAAAAALVFSANPGLTHEQVRQLLKDSADDVGTPGFDTGTGWGRINAATAVAVATGGTIGSAVAFGTGLAGGNGTVPLIAGSGGTPAAGNAAFAITLRRAGALLTAFLPLSLGDAALPFKGGTLHVDPAQLITVPGTTTSGTGTAAFGLALPDDPLIVGLVFDAQWLIQDPGAPLGWALSGGLEVTVGS